MHNHGTVNAAYIGTGNANATFNQQNNAQSLTSDVMLGIVNSIRPYIERINDADVRDEIEVDLESAARAAKKERPGRFLQLAKNISDNLKNALIVGTAAVELKEPIEKFIQEVSKHI